MKSTQKLALSPQSRLKSLISNGYFPVELPPVFTSANYAAHAVYFSNKWQGQDIRKYWTSPENFSIPRYGHARRKLSIVNPVNQLHVSDLISKNWPEIRKNLKRSSTTEFSPQILNSNDVRAVSGVDFDGVARKKAKILAQYGRFVKTDIARFYASIYTHAIPWSLLGRDYCKLNHNSAAFKTSFANYLDKAVGAGQEGQTIGLPIGPDTSRILSELIAVEIEEITKKHIPDWSNRAVRYVDDMLIGLPPNETASTALAGISSALYEYQLELNAEKTVTLGLGQPHSPEWLTYIRAFHVSISASRQREEIDSFFEQAIYLSDSNTRENVLLYACKRAESLNISSENLTHLIRWMLYSTRRSPSCLSFVVEYLISIKLEEKFPIEEISNYAVEQLYLNSESANTSEVAWLLFLSLKLDIKIPNKLSNSITSLRSSIVAILLLRLNMKGLISGKIDISMWNSYRNADGLKSEMWLLIYEATVQNFWPKSKGKNFLTNETYFGDIAAKKVNFYSENAIHTKNYSPGPKFKMPADWLLGEEDSSYF